MLERKPQITWHESPPRPPFNHINLSAGQHPSNPAIDQAIKEIVDQDQKRVWEKGIERRIDEFTLVVLAELHRDGESILLQDGTPRPTFHHTREPDEIELTPYETEALRDARISLLYPQMEPHITEERIGQLVEMHASGEPLGER